ncbi:MAG: hypothetical protein WBO00_04945 [Steroidobacteraceae bacterium]
MNLQTDGRIAPAHGGLRLLLDPYLCFGPGTEPMAPTLAAIAARSAALGLALCVEERSWVDAATDPDVVRRGIDLSRFEPLTRIAELPLPNARDLAACFMPARSELDRTDLGLLGALHARRAELLVADDGRLHRLAKRAGLGERVVTPPDALAWLDSLAGRSRELVVSEADPPAALSDPGLARMLAEDCELFDPYLPARLVAPGSRLLVAGEGDGAAIALGLLVPEAGGLTLAALACADMARGQRALEPVVAAALATARRIRMALTAFVPPHQDHALLLLDLLGFDRRGRDRQGRETFCHAPEDPVARPAAEAQAWLLPLDAANLDRIGPEFAADAQTGPSRPDPPVPTLGSPIRKQLIRACAAREPADGDLLLFHPCATDRTRPASIMAAARITRVRHAKELQELLALTAGREGASMTRQREMLDAGPVSVMDLRWLGRLARPIALSALIERGIIDSTLPVAMPLAHDALRRIAPELVLA